MADQPLNAEVFHQVLSEKFAPVLDGAQRVAVGVSGGPDSMALCVLLAEWAQARGVEVHAITVDHGLRAEAAEEARYVGEALARFNTIQHHILKWCGEKPDSAVQEEARKARYALMVEHCAAQWIDALFLAHHRDDQAETVLFRLSKGSGLDGLCGMREVQLLDGGLVLCRPLLEFSKEDLIAVCEEADIAFIEDPSNESEAYARVRLRKSRAVLEEEGLSAKRLSVSAKRMARARDALDQMAEKSYQEALKNKNTKQIVFKIKSLLEWPEEIILRAVMLGYQEIATERDYAPRMEKVEDLISDLIRAEVFRKRTLGGVIFERDDKSGDILLVLEEASK